MEQMVTKMEQGKKIVTGLGTKEWHVISIHFGGGG